MAIQTRRGLESELDINKAVPGEWLLSTDSRYVRICVQPGIVLRMATYESFESDMVQIKAILAECKSIQSAIQRIQSEVNAKAALTIEYANAAAESAEKAAESEAKAKMYAENAEAVTGIKIATQTTAGIIKGGENYIDESGELQLTKRTDSPTLYNSYAGGIKLNELCGVSEQDSTTGAQLIKSYYVSDTTAQYSTVLQIDADLQPSTQYTISFKGTVGNMLYLNENIVDGYVDMTVKNGINSITFTTLGSLSESEYTSGRGWTFLKNARATSKVNVFEDIMLNAGSTALPWEPYTGNAPSPSPEYPQEINSVEVSGFWGHGKNLLELTLDSKTSQGVLFSVDKENGTVTATGKATGYGQYTFEIDAATLKGKTIILSGTPSATSGSMALIIDGTSTRLYAGDNGKTISVPSTCNQIIFQIAFEADAEAKNDVFKPMIRLASITDDTYEPYQENSITLSKPIKLNGVGTAQDKFVRKDGVWKTERNIPEVVFDGSEYWESTNTDTSGVKRFRTDKLKSLIKSATQNILCTHYVHVGAGGTYTRQDGMGIDGEGWFIVYNNEFSSSTTADFKAHLAENPITVQYEAAVPTYEDLPTADQIALNSLVSYDGITYLYCDSEVQPTWDLEYGTSRVGGYTLEAWNTAMSEKILNESRYNEIVAAMLVMNQE